MFVTEDKGEALLSVVMTENHSNMEISYVKLKGLKAEAMYEDVGTGRRYYGSALMKAGLPLPLEKKEYPAYQIELRVCPDLG